LRWRTVGGGGQATINQEPLPLNRATSQPKGQPGHRSRLASFRESASTLQRFTLEFNLSDLHPGALPPPLSGYALRASAQAGLTSINNSDDAPQWTWAIDQVRTIIKAGKLVLAVDLAGQGGPDSEIVYHDAVLAYLTYQVTVLMA
jgi:hypothetical protein